MLTTKTYADNKSVTYSYDSLNRLATRTWARNSGSLVTTYAYDSNTGEMLSVDYNDSTTDLAYTYNRLGQQKTVTDAVGTRTFAYNSSLQLDSEAISGLYNKTITRSYEATGMVGRYVGVDVKDTPAGATHYDVSYAYDAYGRFASVTDGADAYTYNYLANSNLISSITYPHSINVTKTYEFNRNLILSIDNKLGITSVSKYDYVNDAIGRRTSMGKSGTAFTQADTISYTYNDRSEVTGAVATNDTAYNFGFSFDNIGNRTTYDTTESGTNVQSTYTSNSLNQYTAIDNPVASPTHDDDGNQTSLDLATGSWSLQWNAENRLIEAVKTDSQKITFTHDYMGRRVERKVYSWVSSAWQLDKHEKYIWDGYNRIEILDGLNSDAIKKRLVYGLDITGNLTNAGGVGALLSVNDETDLYYTLYDANGNVCQYLDSSGNIDAKYEYSPNPSFTLKTGAMADELAECASFSTKPWDKELDAFRYELRILKDSRWLNRDPIGERGGWNLYAMLANNPVDMWDSLGLRIGIYATLDVVISICWCENCKLTCKSFRNLKKFLKFLEGLNQETKTLEIRSHGAPDSLDLGKQGVLTVTRTGEITYEDGKGSLSDITNLFKEKLDGAEISLNGCQTGRGKDNISQRLSDAVPNSTVDGGAGRYQLQIPFTAKALGKKNFFKGGTKTGSRWGI